MIRARSAHAPPAAAPKLYRVETPGFVAGFVIEKGHVTACAPILRRHIGRMPERDALAVCKRRWGGATEVLQAFSTRTEVLSTRAM